MNNTRLKATFEVTVSPTGNVERVEMIAGDPDLANAVARAMRQWTFAPFMVQGAPVIAQIRLDYTAASSPYSKEQVGAYQSFQASNSKCEEKTAAMRSKNDASSAEAACRKALTFAQQLPPDPEFDIERAWSLAKVADTEFAQGRFSDAAVTYSGALSRSGPETPDGAAARSDLYFRLGIAESRANNSDKAATDLATSVRLCDEGTSFNESAARQSGQAPDARREAIATRRCLQVVQADAAVEKSRGNDPAVQTLGKRAAELQAVLAREAADAAHEPPPGVSNPRLVVTGGKVSVKTSLPCVKCPSPGYPQLPLMAQIGGTVRITLSLAADGSVREVKIVSGNALLDRATSLAARNWMFPPGDPLRVVSAAIQFEP
ncbi:MAG TPA: TonB family protein [Terriglobales bacterium]|nr:TonB family protein [Terriglobales bacterium]